MCLIASNPRDFIFFRKGVVGVPVIMYTHAMTRFNPNQRPLCIGENNTCTNLAGIKEKRNGKQIYHTRCDRHRRNGHDAKAFTNPESKRYIPLNKCDMCPSEAKERHRIIQGSEYLPETTLTLCRQCHRWVHQFNTFIRSKGYGIVIRGVE